MKRIVILGRTTSGGFDSWLFALWFQITNVASRQPGSSGSVWTEASALEHQAIIDGAVLEEIDSRVLPVGTPVATVKEVLERQWTMRNGQINGIGPNRNRGIFFDDVSLWSA